MNRLKSRRRLAAFFRMETQLQDKSEIKNRTSSIHGMSKALDRRHFLQKMTKEFTKAASYAAFLAACQKSGHGGLWNIENSSLTNSNGKDAPRVVIIGAGLSGLTAAYTLQKAGFRPTIFEARPRIGGRVLSQNHFNADGMFIERGAEFVDTVHQDLIELAISLGLEIQEFVQPVNGLLEEVYFINGKILDPSHFTEEFRHLAKLVINDTRDIRLKDGSLKLPTIGQKSLGSWIDQLSLSEYLEQKRRQGISKEFVNLIELMYLGMLGLEADKQNAFNLLTLMDVNSKEIGLYGDSDESKRIKGGNGRIAKELALQVAKGSSLHLDHQLVKIKDHGNHFTLDFVTGCTSKTIKTDFVLMTVPIPVLKNVDGILDLNLSIPKKNAISFLGYATNSKYSIGFKKRQWREKGQVIPPNYGTVWSNLDFPEVRDSSNNQPGQSGIILNYLSGRQGHSIPPHLREKTLTHLEKLYPGIRSQFDHNEQLTHWSADPFALGSYICPAPRHYDLMGGFEQQSELSSRMLFAGDSLSVEFGGYMNGAIETGKNAALTLMSLLAGASVKKT